jgi:predicted dehydrogenase
VGTISKLGTLLVFALVSTMLVKPEQPSKPLRLIEIDPGHSHISGLHAKSLPGASDEVHLYSPLTPELATHLSALARFNSRLSDPTHWSARVFAGPDYMESFKQESPGNVVALSGNNKKKIGYVLAALEQGQNVFADKPWIIDSEDFPRLESALKLADSKHLVTYDWMTLRADALYQLQRALVGDPSVFGSAVSGTADEPAVRLENLHALLKYSSGMPQRRPASFMDVRQQGEGMADVGTHLVDLVQWTLFPEQPISYSRDIHVLRGEHSPLNLTLEQFMRLTGETDWPDYLKQNLVNNTLRYFANSSCLYTLRGIYIELKVGWQFEAPKGAQDSYYVSYKGTRSLIELRAGANEHYTPEIYVTPNEERSAAEVQQNLENAIARLSGRYPNLSVEKAGGTFHVVVPKADRSGEDLYSLFEQFAGVVHNYNTFPSYENTNLLAKYYVTTKAVELARSHD